MVLPHFEQALVRMGGVRGKKQQIAFMPRKRPNEAKQLQQWFAALCPQWAHVPWVEVDGMSRPQVAQTLAESLVFVSLSKDEGLGLPPLEAMAAGCLVAGFTGGGGQEYATPVNGLWVGEAQLPELALAIASLLAMDVQQQAARVQVGQATAALFDSANFDAKLNSAWHQLLGDAAAAYKIGTNALLPAGEVLRGVGGAA
jgi:glycosyltransferase involved in cell wall biosynthesis